MKKLIILTLAIFIAPLSYAACSAPNCVTTPSMVYTTGYTRVHVQIPDSLSPLNCTPAEGIYLTLHDNHVHFQQIYDTLNAAMILDKSVNIRIVQGSSDCSIAYTMLYQ